MEKEIDKRLKRFGIYFGSGMLILFAISFIKNFSFYLKIAFFVSGLYHLTFAFINPKFLKPTFFLVSKLTFLIGDIITKISLIIFFYLIFSPIALILRLFGKDEIKKNLTSPYWQDIEEKENNPERLEKMY